MIHVCVQIIDVPPGFAPPEIREQWKKIVLPVITESEMATNPPNTRYGVDAANVGGFTVSRPRAVAALTKRGRSEAAGFWTGFPFGPYLQFRKDVCRVIRVVSR